VKLERLLLSVGLILLGLTLVLFLTEPDPGRSRHQAVTSTGSGQPVDPASSASAPQGTAPDAAAGNGGTQDVAVTPPTEALCVSVFALPGIQDFEVSSCTGGRWSLMLAEEDLDAGWATVMQARIRELIDQNERLEFSRIEVVCRNTACGILLIPVDEAQGEYVEQELARVMLESLAAPLGFEKVETLRWISDDGIEFHMALLEHALDREHFWPPPTERRRVEALPGIPGYEVVEDQQIAAFSFPMAAELLAAEAVDPAWAPAMESRILGEIGSIGIPLNQLHVVCRTTRCGIVLDHPEGLSPSETQAAAGALVGRLRDSLDLSHCTRDVTAPPASTFTALYFERNGRGTCSLED